VERKWVLRERKMREAEANGWNEVRGEEGLEERQKLNWQNREKDGGCSGVCVNYQNILYNFFFNYFDFFPCNFRIF